MQINAAKEFADKWRLSANVKKSAVMMCNEDREEPVEQRWKWGFEEIEVVDQYTHLGVEIAKDCSWNAHMCKMAEKGKERAGKLHPILANRHRDTRIKLTVLNSATVVNELEAAQIKATKVILGFSSRTSSAAGRAELTGDLIPKVTYGWVRIDEGDTLDMEGLKGFKEKLPVACAEREEQNLRKEAKYKEAIEVYGMLKEGIGFKQYLHGPMDAGTELKVKFRTVDIDLRERRRR
ncbi:unnamed protein product [Ectocarpus sp. CCAP 1310/34]|nr:unnamed protein product [Ectocarpus sp. CCAP 1310/34]